MARATCVKSRRFAALLEALFADLRAVKRDAPLSRVGVLVPNRALLRWVRPRLARGGAMLGVEVMTLNGLAERLAGWPGPVAGPEVHRLVVGRIPVPPWLDGYADPEGLLMAALRDLHDAGLEPAHALAVADALRDEPWWARGRSLLDVFARWREAMAAAGLPDRTDLVREATRRVSSGRPHGFDALLYYGIYDLTGAMADFVQALCRTAPGQIYFPGFEPSPGAGPVPATPDEYLLDVFESVVLPAVEGVRGLPCDDASPPVESFDASGERAELSEVARRIARWAASQGGAPPWHEVAIVARDLDPYLQPAREVMRCFRIPIAPSREAGGRAFGRVRSLCSAVELARHGVRREDFVDAIRSGGPEAREGYGRHLGPLDAALRHFGVLGGDDWDVLAAHVRGGRPLLLPTPGGADAAPGSVLDQLLSHVQEARSVIGGWPDLAPIDVHLARWDALVRAVLRCDGGEPAASVAPALAATPGPLQRRAFLASVERVLDSWTPDCRSGPGVALLDVMSARGMVFEHLFLVGVNRGRWPRTIQEDVLLPDRIRSRLRAELGLDALAVKERGHAEEALLFRHAVESATRSLTVSWLRSGEDGRALSPSPLVESLRRRSSPGGPHRSVPRRKVEVIEPLVASMDLAALPPPDLAYWLCARCGPEGARASERLSDPTGSEPLRRRELLRAGLEALSAREDIGRPPSDHDGIVGPLDAGSREAGPLVPTRLEELLRCPWRFFVRRILRVEPVGRVGEIPDPDRRLLGAIVHEVQERLVRWLQPTDSQSRDTLLWEDAGELAQRWGAELLHETLAGRPAVAELGHRLVEPTLRELLDGLVSLLGDQYSAGTGVAPLRAEDTLAGAVELPDGRSVRLSARADRADLELGTGRLLLVDLKTGGALPETPAALLREMAAGRRLQAAFYHWLAPDARWAGYELAAAGGVVGRMGLERSEWLAAERELCSVLAVATDLLAGGRFVLRRGPHCDFCEVTASCSRQHRPATLRLERLVAAQPALCSADGEALCRYYRLAGGGAS